MLGHDSCFVGDILRQFENYFRLLEDLRCKGLLEGFLSLPEPL